MHELLQRGQRAGTIGVEIHTDEVMALVASACQGALLGGWEPELRQRTLDIMFAGLATAGPAARRVWSVR